MSEQQAATGGPKVKKFMFVNRKAPYGTIYALESLEVVKGQQTKGIGIKNFSPSYRALDGYDVEKLYVDQASLEQRGLTEKDLLVPVEVLDAQQMGQLMAQQDVILSF